MLCVGAVNSVGDSVSVNGIVWCYMLVLMLVIVLVFVIVLVLALMALFSVMC